MKKLIFLVALVIVILVIIGSVYIYQHYSAPEGLVFYESRTPDETQQIIDKLGGGQIKVMGNSENPYFKKTELGGKYLLKAEVIFEPENFKPAVQLKFDDVGKKLLEEITARNIGKPLAIFLDGVSILDTSKDGKIDVQDLFAPIIKNKVTDGKVLITGDMYYQEADSVAKKLNSCLKVNPWIRLIFSHKFGPGVRICD